MQQLLVYAKPSLGPEHVVRPSRHEPRGTAQQVDREGSKRATTSGHIQQGKRHGIHADDRKGERESEREREREREREKE